MRTPVTHLTLIVAVAAIGLLISNPLYAGQAASIPGGMLTDSSHITNPSVMLTAHGHGGGHGGGGGWHGARAFHGGGGWRHGGGWYGGAAYLNPGYSDDYYTYAVPSQECVWDGYEYVCDYDQDDAYDY